MWREMEDLMVVAGDVRSYVSTERGIVSWSRDRISPGDLFALVVAVLDEEKIYASVASRFGISEAGLEPFRESMLALFGEKQFLK